MLGIGIKQSNPEPGRARDNGNVEGRRRLTTPCPCNSGLADCVRPIIKIDFGHVCYVP